MRLRALVGFTIVLVGAAPPALAQDFQLDSLLAAEARPLSLEDGRVEGPAVAWLLEAARHSQFVAIAEEHNVGALAALATALFDTLHAAYGFRYLALEQGGVITSWLNAAARAGEPDSVSAIVRRWPHAPTFATDEELAMIAHVAQRSTASHDAVWGLDQELGALHILDRLVELAPSQEARTRARALADTARTYEADRSGDIHYLAEVAVPADFAELPTLFGPNPGAETDNLIASLQRTNRIYHNHHLSQQGQPTAYASVRERESSMKARFMEEYRRAQATGDSLPRVLLKLGHWHVFRGIYRSNVTTLGNFVDELATANGMGAFILSTYVVESPEEWRNSGSTMESVALPDEEFTLVDLRPLRKYAHQDRIAELSEGWQRLLFRADALLIIRGGRTGSYTIAR